MVNPLTSMENLVYFRASMRKFRGSTDDTLSVLAYSKPYSFGKLNAELVTLLSALGIRDEIFLQKQREYFDLIAKASEDPVTAFIFLSYMGEREAAEEVVLNGLESVKGIVKKAQETAWAKMFDKRDSERVHLLVPRSRILFGVCDPTEKLRENECHVRISVEGKGISSFHGAWVIVGRNPCLHPGDIRKLYVKHVPELERLVDCIVFPTTGRVPRASMMSGGDLDGDQFFVCWDPDLIPETMHEPHFYPPARERPRHIISHNDLIRYFAQYNNASLGRVKNLYLDWVRSSDRGAACEQCLELNYLFSNCVDGEKIRIPQKLLEPPKRANEDKYILDKLTDEVTKMNSTKRFGLQEGIESFDIDIIEYLAAADDVCLDEFELFQLVHKWTVTHNTSLAQFITHFDFGALTADQRAWVRTSSKLREDPTIDLDALLKNGLLQSSILSTGDRRQYRLHSSNLHFRRLYGSDRDGEPLFLPTLTKALEDFKTKFLIVDIENRFKVGILISKRLKPFETVETVVDDSVTVFPFRAGIDSIDKRVRTRSGFRLSWDGRVFQLFNSRRGATFIYMRRPEARGEGELGIISIDLTRFGQEVSRNKVFKNAMQTVEIYVISNRDRIGQQILDLSAGNVPTTQVISRVVNVPQEYEIDTIDTVDWEQCAIIVREVVKDGKWNMLNGANLQDVEAIAKLCAQLEMFQNLSILLQWCFTDTLPFDIEPLVNKLLDWAPRVCVLIAEISENESYATGWNGLRQSSTFAKKYITAIIRSANYAVGLVSEEFDENPRRYPLGFSRRRPRSYFHHSNHSPSFHLDQRGAVAAGRRTHHYPL